MATHLARTLVRRLLSCLPSLGPPKFPPNSVKVLTHLQQWSCWPCHLAAPDPTLVTAPSRHPVKVLEHSTQQCWINIVLSGLLLEVLTAADFVQAGVLFERSNNKHLQKISAFQSEGLLNLTPLFVRPSVRLSGRPAGKVTFGPSAGARKKPPGLNFLVYL